PLTTSPHSPRPRSRSLRRPSVGTTSDTAAIGSLYSYEKRSSAIPFAVVSQLVSLNRADCLINFPYYTIHKWVGWLEKESHDGDQRLAIVDQLLNGQAWREIAF